MIKTKKNKGKIDSLGATRGIVLIKLASYLAKYFTIITKSSFYIAILNFKLHQAS